MKNYFLILGIISILLISACSQQPESLPAPQPKAVIEPAEEAAKPSISTDNQKVINDNVVIKSLFLDKPGYVEIHKVEDGKAGLVIGNSKLLNGENTNVKVKISDYENENELIAMLHYDDGDEVHEFPGDDKPTTADGKVVLQKFSLTKAEQQTEVPTAKSEPNLVEIDMTARQWAFEPSTIRVKEGDRVRLNIKNEDVTHGFAIFEFDVNERLLPGKTTTIEFTADKKGEYTFFCSVTCGKGHRDMKGKLIVE